MTPNRKTYWTFKCECGNIKVLRLDGVKSGRIKSCGCLKKETDRSNAKVARQHNLKFDKDQPLSKHPLYSKWMERRFRNRPNKCKW